MMQLMSGFITQVTRVNEKRSKTVNLCTNLMKVGKRRRMDFGYTLIFFLGIFAMTAYKTKSIVPKYPDTIDGSC